jgi:serine/threonine-protein kinase
MITAQGAIPNMTTLFNGRYRITETIGSGGMGTVYLAESVSLGTKWAIKAVEKKHGANFDLLAEPNILKKLNHPALPRIVDIEQDDEFLYIIEDYIEGAPLDKQLRLRKSFDEATVIEWCKQLCAILIYLHGQRPNPVIYRDMKPSNIIVSADNVVRVIDFGIAREYKSDSGSDTSYMGTRGYAAPEQYGTSQTDARTDIYALGATAYHLLTGVSPNEPPYEFLPLRRMDGSFSEGIEFIVGKCVQNNPKDRYQSAEDLLYDLENIYAFNSLYKRRKLLGRLLFLFKFALLGGFSWLLVFSWILLGAERAEKYDAFVDAGLSALQLYRFEEASSHFEAAINTDGERFDAYYGMAQIRWKQGEFEACLAYLNDLESDRQAVRGDAEFNYLKGIVYFDSGQWEDALPYLELASDLRAETSYTRDFAVCLAKTGDLDRADDVLREMVANGVSDDVSEYVRGEIQSVRGNFDEAVADFTRVKDETNDEILKKKAYTALSDLYKTLRHSDAQALANQISVLEEAVRELGVEDDVILTETLAEAYYTAQEYARAGEKFQKLIDIGYERPYIYRNLAIIEQQQRKFSEAEACLSLMREKYPDDYRGYLQFAYLYAEIEGEKPQGARNYSAVVENYDLACGFAPQGANTADIMPLANLIDELRKKGWI